MSTIGPTVVQDASCGGSLRVLTDLAAGATIANGNVYRARFSVPNAHRLNVRVKMSVSGGTPTVQWVPQTANIGAPDLTVSDAAAGVASATNLVDATEALAQYTMNGERVVDLVIDAQGASAAGTLTSVDVSIDQKNR